MVMFLADGIEALVRLGYLDRAARRLHRGWALAQAGRCRALLHAARGDFAAALAASDACRAAERLELRLEYARTLLVAGEIEGRSRRRRPARNLCGPWRSSKRPARGAGPDGPAPKPTAPPRAGRAKGSPSRQAGGGSCRVRADEPAGRRARLFISPKTVEANLARVYRKLGIRSRAELGARLASAEREAL
jgi:Bacterial regulatory proteins, luxR family